MHHAFNRLAARVSTAMGSLAGFCAMLGFTAACLMLGPWIGWLTAQVLLTTAVGVITQLTAMLLQRSQLLLQESQDRSEKAIQLKLDNLTLAMKDASNRLLHAEEKSPEELNHLRDELSEKTIREE